jgi:hypothetical protein
MNSSASDSSPTLPMWIFYVADALLLGTAWFIAETSPKPLPASSVIWIVVLVFGGVMVALVPLLVRYERQRSEALDERQQAIEALAANVNSSAEQLGIAAAGLHAIAELAQKNLRQAEHLPHKLQEKIAEFQAGLANAQASEREELEKQIAELRGLETERLEGLSDKIGKAAAELARLETATHQHVLAGTEAVARLASGTAAIAKAQTAAEQALGRSGLDTARTIAESTAAAVRSIDAAKAAALVAIEARLAGAAAAAAERAARDFTAGIAAAVAQLEGKLLALGLPPGVPPVPMPEVTAGDVPETAPVAAVQPVPAGPAAKRPRKPREPAAADPAGIAAAAAEPAPAAALAVTPQTPAEPPVLPAAAESAVSGAPVDTPISGTGAERTPGPDHTGNGAAADATPAPPRTEPRRGEPGRKRARKADANGEPALTLDVEETGVIERVITSDGATRLLVTAYIGIGNRLFIRGDGPGLSWDKGIPLQFVSIGKWRWETNDATAPVRFKLLKNDEHECAALGAQTLDPGHQQEVTAAF